MLYTGVMLNNSITLKKKKKWFLLFKLSNKLYISIKGRYKYIFPTTTTL